MVVVGCSFLVDKKVCRSSGLRLEESWTQAALASVGNSTSRIEKEEAGKHYTEKCFQSWRKGQCFPRNSRDAPEGRQGTIRYSAAEVGWYYRCSFPKMFVCFGCTSLEFVDFLATFDVSSRVVLFRSESPRSASQLCQ